MGVPVCDLLHLRFRQACETGIGGLEEIGWVNVSVANSDDYESFWGASNTGVLCIDTAWYAPFWGGRCGPGENPARPTHGRISGSDMPDDLFCLWKWGMLRIVPIGSQLSLPKPFVCFPEANPGWGRSHLKFAADLPANSPLTCLRIGPAAQIGRLERVGG